MRISASMESMEDELIMAIEMAVVDWGFSLRLYPLVGCNLHLKTRVEKRIRACHM